MEPDEPITIQVKYTPQDLEQAQRLMTWRGQQHWLLRVAVLVVCVTLVWLLLPKPAHHGPSHITVPWMNLITVFIMAALFIAFWVFVLRQAGRFITDDQTYDMSFSEEGHRLRTATTEFSCTWSYFTSARENAQIILLIVNPHTATIIPKRLFSDVATVDRLRTLIERHVGTMNGKPISKAPNTSV